MEYHFYHLKDRSKSQVTRLVPWVKEAAGESQLWGIFPGLFGLGTNEVYCVGQADLGDFPRDQVEVLQQVVLTPTVRPKQFEPCCKPGVYVYRWFEVAADKHSEVVALSNEAWETFEGGFDTEVQGLFTVNGQSPFSMLLVTWYKDLTVWQASREPAPEARKNFQARQALLDSAKPIATRLIL